MFKKDKADNLFSFPLFQLNQQERKIIIALIAVCLSLWGTFALTPLQAHAQTSNLYRPAYSGYNCVSKHCYANVDWNGGPVTGSSVFINEGFITCGNCNGFINNEMWLLDQTDSSCTSIQYNACWVEAGYATFTTNNSTNPGGKPSCVTNSAANCYFWADNRSNQSQSFALHVIANVPSNDYGNDTNFTISQASSNSWTVQISTASGPYYQATSAANQMSPYDIQIGQELYGTNGAGANRTDFYDAQWENSHGFHYQTQAGSVPPPNNPPYGHWASPPASDGSNYGGDFCTAC